MPTSFRPEQPPVLLAKVINMSDGLISGCPCNIDGLDFMRISNAKINSQDQIFNLPTDARG